MPAAHFRVADLHCKKDGLKIGASRIGIDLNGHAIIGPGLPDTKGIQNSGYDNVGIHNGTVRGFDRGIEVRKGARDFSATGMDVRGGHYGLVMYDSSGGTFDGNDNISAGAAKDGYDGGFGAAIALYRSHDNWFEENGSHDNGVNVVVLDNSHRNGITETGFVGDGPLWSAQCRGIPCVGK